MKVSIILIVIGFLIMPFMAVAQPLPKVTYNYKNCTLTVKANRWIKEKGKDILIVDATLFNNSNDTLKYATELCFENEVAGLKDTTQFTYAYAFDDCLKNWEMTAIILPRKRKTAELKLIKKGSTNQPLNLQLRTTLQLVNIDIYSKTMDEFVHNSQNYGAFEKALAVYKVENEHSYLSNVITVH